MADIAIKPLHSCEGDTANFGTVEPWQTNAALDAIEFTHEALAIAHIPKIDEGISHVTTALEVHG